MSCVRILGSDLSGQLLLDSELFIVSKRVKVTMGELKRKDDEGETEIGPLKS